MGWLRFVLSNLRWLAAGFLLCFASSFGQTFFISLFAADIRGDLGLSHGDFGTIYAAATLASGLAILKTGGAADTVPVARLAWMVLAGLAIGCLAMATAGAAWVLLPTIFTLRYCGQGMLSHLAITAVVRWFVRRRGRALAIAMLGFAAGEAFWPSIAIAVRDAIGWRETWLFCVALVLLLYAPLLTWLLSSDRTPAGDPSDLTETVAPEEFHWTRSQVLRDRRYWFLLPGILAPPFIMTGTIFHQVALAQDKGWEMAEFARGYPAYAAASVTFSLLTGWIIDRYGARRVLPWYLLPMAAGLLVLASGRSVWAGPLGLFLFGCTSGCAATLLGAIWAEIYGTLHLGAIRALAVAAMIFATALAPSFMGILLDLGVGLSIQYVWMAAYAILASAWFVALSPKLVARPAAAAA